jgi:hypothetical protein
MIQEIQVHPELYEYLSLMRQASGLLKKQDVTFADIIANEINKANGLTAVISRLVREFPDERERITQIAKDTEEYEYVKPIVECIGKNSKVNKP